jgi:hypothetical protein
VEELAHTLLDRIRRKKWEKKGKELTRLIRDLESQGKGELEELLLEKQKLIALKKDGHPRHKENEDGERS